MQTISLTTKPVPKLFFQYLIPSICGTMVTSIYVLADTIIVGKGIGITAMAALNIILPIFSLLFGTGLLFGIGGSVLMSISRGRGDIAMGERYFTVAFFLNLFFYVLYTLLFFFFMKPFARFLGGTDVTLPYIMNYLPWIIGGTLIFSFSTFLQAFIRNDGAPKLSMAAVVTGGIINVVLDIFFVFPCHMGMAGAAIASVIGSFFTDCILFSHFLSKKNGLHFRIKGISASHFHHIFANGFTSFLIEMSSGIVMFVFNLQILKYVGNIGVSLYGVITNTAIVVSCLSNGISQAAQPIISTNYGAGHSTRITQVKKLGLKTALFVCSVPTILGLVAPNAFTYVFLHPTKEILALSSSAIRIYFIAFVVTGINMFIINYFQATARSGYSLLLCLLRGCVLSVLFVNILPPLLGVTGIWMSVPLAEFISLLLGVFLLKKDTLHTSL
ncbi:MAG: MATE family efflux transporter [Lachnospiraceae bacterium]